VVEVVDEDAAAQPKDEGKNGLDSKLPPNASAANNVAETAEPRDASGLGESSSARATNQNQENQNGKESEPCDSNVHGDAGQFSKYPLHC